MRSLAKLIVAVCALSTGLCNVHAATIGIDAHDLKLVRGTDRVWTHGQGWLLRMNQLGEVQTGEFALPQQIAPGTYRLFIEARNGGAKIRVACGGSTGEVGDFHGPWSNGIPLKINAATKTITLTATNSRPDAVNFILQYLALTDEEGVTIEADYVVQLPREVTADDSPAIPGNRIPNSSFEVGLGRGWLLSTPKERRDFGTAAIVDEMTGYDGRASVKLPAWSSLTSRVFRVRPWRKHTFSLWAKSEAAKANFIIELFNVHRDKAVPGFAAALKKTFSLEKKNGWQRLVLGDRLSGFPAPEYQLRICSASDEPVWIDALQLEEGSASAYRPMSALEVGLVSDKAANLFLEDEPIRMKLLAFNSSAQPVAATVRYQIYDYLNRKVNQDEVAVAAPAHSHLEKMLDLSTGKRGIFRVMLWLERINGSDEEVVYSVVPRPQREGPDPSSIIGVHAISSDFQYEVLQRMGVKWQRILSPELWFRWSAAEPQQGRFVWHDAEAEKTVRHGFQILGNLTTEPWPKWAGRLDTKAWEQSVLQLVNHYKPWVKYWEVCNEPIYQFKPKEYARMLRAATLRDSAVPTRKLRLSASVARTTATGAWP